jgi:hypothetical protein
MVWRSCIIIGKSYHLRGVRSTHVCVCVCVCVCVRARLRVSTGRSYFSDTFSSFYENVYFCVSAPETYTDCSYGLNSPA